MADLSRVMLITSADRDAMVRAFNRVGSVFQGIQTAMVEGFAAMSREALAKAYPAPLRPWLHLLRRPDPTIGRKRRARRARGRRQSIRSSSRG